MRSKAQIAEGGLREADVDERAFNQLRQIRAEHGDLTLEEFKRDAARTVLRADA